ncbi:MAG: molecular chaperone GrpE [Solirubrobacteraceae bacterium]|nr:molecular chaperone GrpE [Solirubrobacteraceae bacterium]
MSAEPNQPAEAAAEIQTEAPPVEEASTPGAGGADTPPVEPASEPDPIAVAEARAAEYLDMAKRKQAEFENFRKRMALQVGQAEERGVAKLAKELLPALDHLELALQAAESHAGGEEWVKGIRLVQDEVTGALGRAGIQTFAPVGDPFDPNEHEAMAQAPVDGAVPGTVAQVYQAGYRLNGAVLRPARVVVAQ